MNLILGIDVGTTSLKVSCVQVEKLFGEIDGRSDRSSAYKVLQRVSLPYHQHLKSDEFIYSNKDNLDALLITGECNPFLVLGTLVCAVSQLNAELRRRVDAVAVCGQMHGCLYYGDECLQQIRSVGSDGALEFDLKFDRDYRNRVSNFFTWEDQRCDKTFLDQLPGNADFANRLAYTGYATATTFWFLKNDPEYLMNFRFMGSLMDFIVHLLCPDLEHPVTSNQLANSFGYFDMKTNDWSKWLYDARFGFPRHLLPTVLGDSQVASRLRHRFLELKPGTPVFVACGDLQCAIYSAMFGKRRAAILNSGTSMQLAFPLAKADFGEIRSTSLLKLFASKVDQLPVDMSADEVANECIHLDVVPYFNGSHLVTSSSLNGGNVIAFFIRAIKKFVTDLFGGEIELRDDQIWPRISSLTKEYVEKRKAADRRDVSEDDVPNVVPLLYGERYEEIKSKFSISSISVENFELGKLYYSLCSGILKNIFDRMCPIELLQRLRIDKLVAVGSTVTNNEILRLCLEEKLNKAKLELIYESDAEADVGVCLFIAEQLKSVR